MLERVLIVNKFYYPRGGDCVCTINLEKLLAKKGHETAIFAMQYPENLSSDWSPYFASEVKFGGGLSSLFEAAKRSLGLGDIKKQFKAVLDQFKPDVVHLNNIHSYLSPVLAVLAKEAGARVVWTMHDYKLLCPSYSCIYNGTPCEACFSNKFNVVKKRCMKNSLPASVVAWIESLKWNRRKLENSVDTFICPSSFINKKMAQGGFAPAKLATVCNFVDPVKLDTLSSLSNIEREPGTYCYIGRLSTEKGIAELLSVAAQLPQYKLKVAGTGPLADQLKAKFKDCPNIEFLGHLDASQVSNLLASSKASIIPSRCYENNPLGVIESLCAGTPVIGAEIGGIPELISGDSGVTYRWNDNKAMMKAIETAMNTEWDHNRIADESRVRFSADTHYDKLIGIYRGNRQ